MAGTASPPFSRDGLARFLTEASGAASVETGALELLAGGAIQHNWGFEAAFRGGSLSGPQRLVLRTDAPTGIPTSLGRIEEFRAERRGQGWVVTEYVIGSAGLLERLVWPEYLQCPLFRLLPLRPCVPQRPGC